MSTLNDDTDLRRAVGATALILALFAAVFIGGRGHDRSHAIAGMPCSVLSEDAISAVVGSRVELVPVAERTCRYVATDAARQISVIVVAAPRPSGGIAYRFVVTGPGLDAAAARRDEARLAAQTLHRTLAIAPGSLGTPGANAAARTHSRTP